MPVNLGSPPSGRSSARSIGVACQAGSVIVPAWPSAVAAARVNETEPKFASGSVRQPPGDKHEDGASAIHSAEVRSGCATVTRRVTRTRRVVFVSWSVTCAALDENGCGEPVAGRDLHRDRDRRRRDDLVPRRVNGTTTRVAVGLCADLLERLGVGREAAEPDPEGGVRGLPGRAGHLRLHPGADHVRVGRRCAGRVRSRQRVPGPVRRHLALADGARGEDAIWRRVGRGPAECEYRQRHEPYGETKHHGTVASVPESPMRACSRP